MKTSAIRTFLVRFFSFFLFILILSSCQKENNSDFSDGTFIIGTTGTGEYQRGLYTYTVGDALPVFLTDQFPHNYSSYFADQNAGTIAFAVATPLRGNNSGIAFMHKENLDQVLFVPVPVAPEGYYYNVWQQTPKVLPDNRIAYRVSLETDSEYDTWFAGMIAIYNPVSGEIELSGDPTDFVLSQPEQLSDTEDGTMKAGFAVSPDGRYLYCEVYGYGTEGGNVHRDFSFIVRYTVGQPGSYERLIQMKADPVYVTGDNRYLILAGDFGTRKLDLNTNIMTDIASNYLGIGSGQMSKNSSRFLHSWGSSNSNPAGFGEYSINQDPAEFLHIVNQSELEEPTNFYSNITLGTQYAKDESRVYFGIRRSSSSYGKYIDLASTPKNERITNPELLGEIPEDFDMNVLIFVR